VIQKRRTVSWLANAGFLGVSGVVLPAAAIASLAFVDIDRRDAAHVNLASLAQSATRLASDEIANCHRQVPTRRCTDADGSLLPYDKNKLATLLIAFAKDRGLSAIAIQGKPSFNAQTSSVSVSIEARHTCSVMRVVWRNGCVIHHTMVSPVAPRTFTLYGPNEIASTVGAVSSAQLIQALGGQRPLTWTVVIGPATIEGDGIVTVAPRQAAGRDLVTISASDGRGEVAVHHIAAVTYDRLDMTDTVIVIDDDARRRPTVHHKLTATGGRKRITYRCEGFPSSILCDPETGDLRIRPDFDQIQPLTGIIIVSSGTETVQATLTIRLDQKPIAIDDQDESGDPFRSGQ
jgi:hypothetical protein